MRTFYAHSFPDNPDKTLWEEMHQHEQLVAERCEAFLGKIDQRLSAWGDLLGRWHDIGKYSQKFQDYLCSTNGCDSHTGERTGRVDHSTAGAQLADRRFQRIGKLLAYCIAGHHAGLPDWISNTGNPASGLNERLKKCIEEYTAAPEALLTLNEPPLPQLNLDRENQSRLAFELSLFTRVCFSALCDADFLATEAFMSPQQAKNRPAYTVALDDMRDHLAEHMQALMQGAEGPVNRVRCQVLDSSIEASTLEPGLFSLNVPTGGGKTLASLSFALAHAVRHGLDRVIYAIPFTSIIEQTSDVFRTVFDSLAPDLVLEHHSNLDPDVASTQSRWAAENWDSPLVVTTNVQFFESLFASKTSRSRKVHRIAKSVVILDEAHTLPIHLLEPCLAVLREVCSLLGSTVVLCTATQPAIEYRTEFTIGLEQVRPIVAEPQELYASMRRVHCDLLGQCNNEELCRRFADHEQLLCVVNTRPHAAELFRGTTETCEPNTVVHLSTFMCAAHRNSVFQAIRERLDNRELCRVISTQLIEAGVDVDFPVVYRAMAGLDSIAQAAGRCNREGKLNVGCLFVFEPEKRAPGTLGQMADKSQEVIPGFEDILSLDAVQQYFRLHYWQQSARWDEKNVMECLRDPQGKQFQFRTAADRFRMIEDTSRSVFVPWSNTGAALEEELRSADYIDRRLRRKVQRYLVPVYERAFNAMVGNDIDVESVEGIPILVNRDLYDEQLGLQLERAGQHDPGGLIV